MKTKIRIDSDILKKFYLKKRSKIRIFFSFIWAKLHLLFLCPRCDYKKRITRDIENNNDCFWYLNWKEKNYDIPFWMGFKKWKRIRKELKLKFKNKK